ncbi:MAG TPA: VacJ family lipoprotein [Candidatus Saccharimonadales bacterium]|nr:VacJ family lipoprotein [Candidatus Saccharimonadales bacterium]
MPDPLEPVNRIMWDFNKELLTHVIKPSSKAYRAVVIKPVRTAITHFGRNLLYPDRLLNNLLQGRWAGARDETSRFLCNTLAGGLGFIDVATWRGLPKSDATFGDTFGQWGWNPQFFLMLPLLGPSNDRDGLGLAADAAANPLIYFDPYSYITYGVYYNNVTDQVDDYVRFSQAEMDPYSLIQYAWTFVRENHVVNFKVEGKQDRPSLETLQSVFFTFDNPEFPDQCKTRSVLIPGTGKKLKFTYWLQHGRAPVVYIVPGLGSHRMSETSIALAELAYKNGFSAVCVSSPFNAEFMEEASTAALPAYSPVDCHDLHVALTEVDHQLGKMYPGRIASRALMGYSMGAYESLYIAAGETNQANLLKFDRYVAINSPVRLLHGIDKLDEFYDAPLQWPAAERTEKIHNTFLKVAALSRSPLRPKLGLPFDAVESRFLIGITFRFILRDIIYSSQERHNQGVLRQPIKDLRRASLYDEILGYSYGDYFAKFVVPYYETRGVDLKAPDALEKASNLRSFTDSLRANPDIRLVENEDDFLLSTDDTAWLQSTFGPRMTLFVRGGHLGNLSHRAVQKAVLAALEERRPVPQGKQPVGPPPQVKDKDTPAKVPAIP